MPDKDALYVPPEVWEGILVSGIPVSEAKVVKAVKSKNKVDSGEVVPVQAAEAEAQIQTNESEVTKTQEECSSEPLQSTSVEARPDEAASGSEADDVEDVVNNLVDRVDILEKDEAVGGALGGSADPEGNTEFPVATIREGMPRDEMAQETTTDESLRAILKLAQIDREGYHLSQGLVFRTRLDTFGLPREQLCVPQRFRQQCLKAAHTSFGHQGRNRMVALLRPHFYWPYMGRDCVQYVKACHKCQQMDKCMPRPPPMTERPVVTRPFSDVAVDVVGPFPTAWGGYCFMLTCIDSASRWPEAFPVRTGDS